MPTLESARMPSLRDKQLAQAEAEATAEAALPAKKAKVAKIIKKKTKKA